MIIVTAGPNLFEKGIVSELCEKGLGAIRIPTSKQPPLEQINKIADELKSNVKILIDLPGAKYRLNNPNNYSVKKGDILTISKNEMIYDFVGQLAVYPKIDFDICVGDIFVIGDGETAFQVIEDNTEQIIVKVEKDTILGPRRGITPECKTINYQVLTENDYQNMSCLSNKTITGIILSFVENAEEIVKIKKYVKDTYNRNVEIYAKVETKKGINNLSNIVSEADYVILARGDLLITAGEEDFPILQEEFLEKMKSFSKKAIIATELAHSVGTNYLMSRSELTFLYLIGKMGYKNLMLASETTVLCDPIEVFEKISHLIDFYANHKK